MRQLPAGVVAFSSMKMPSSRRCLTPMLVDTSVHKRSYPYRSLKQLPKRGFSTHLFESVDKNAMDATAAKRWNVGGLQKEVARLTVRCHKKIGKARERLEKANQEVERLTSDSDVTLEELEKCPNVDAMKADLEELQTRLKNLNKLEVRLTEVGLKGKFAILPEDVSTLAIQLEVNDEPPPVQEKVTKKEKGPRLMESFRLPYRRYFSESKTEIRVRSMTKAVCSTEAKIIIFSDFASTIISRLRLENKQRTMTSCHYLQSIATRQTGGCMRRVVRGRTSSFDRTIKIWIRRLSWTLRR